MARKDLQVIRDRRAERGNRVLADYEGTKERKEIK